MKFSFSNLSFTVNGQLYLRDLSATLGPSVNLICGRNGSGKTTLLRLLANFEIQKSHLAAEGIDKISHMPLSTAGLLGNISGKELLDLFAKLKQCDPVQNSIYYSPVFQKCLELSTSEFSNGMRQLFKYYLHTFWNPDLILLDEPLSFLDKENQKLILGDIKERSARAVIFLTHQESEIADLDFELKMELHQHV